MNEWYTAAVPNPPPRCLKLRLLPYTLGHEILIERLAGSPDQAADPNDRLILAVLICSQSYESALGILRSPFLVMFLRLWRLVLGTPDWPTQTRIFNDYRAAGSWMPEANRSIGREPFVSPGAIRLMACLMRDLHLTSSQALNMPLALANALYSAMGEMQGTISLFSKTDAAMLEKARQMDEASASAASPA